MLHSLVEKLVSCDLMCVDALPHRYITQQGNKLEVSKTKVPTTVTNAVSWRSEGIKYKKNEVFIDVIESINVLVSYTSSVCVSRELLTCLSCTGV